MDNVKEFLGAMNGHIGQVVEKPLRLYFEVPDEQLLETVSYLFGKLGCRLSTATATEVYRGIEVLYHFSHDATGQYFCPRVVITDKEHPRMHSITPIVKGAEWIEREMKEFWGVEFIDHPRPERLLSRNHPENLDQPMRFRRMS